MQNPEGMRGMAVHPIHTSAATRVADLPQWRTNSSSGVRTARAVRSLRAKLSSTLHPHGSR
jgi:hypothetical protein